MFVYAHVNSNTHNVQFSHIASTDNNYDISVYSIFWIALLNTASLMLSVTWLAFFQFFFLFNRKCQAFLIASFLFFWALRYYFFCRCWKIKFYSTSRQTNLHPAMCREAAEMLGQRLGETLRNSWLPVGHKVCTQRRGRRKMVGVNLQLSCPSPERQLWCCSPCLQGNCSGPCVGLCFLRHFPPLPFYFLSLRVITWGCKLLLLRKNRRPAPSIGFSGCCFQESAIQGNRAACFWRLSKTLKWDVFCIYLKFRDVFCVCKWVGICICVCMRVHVYVHVPTHIL